MAVYNIGQYIKLKREQLGITQAALCEGLCTQATLSRIETGEQIPQGDTMLSLLQRLGESYLSIDSLMSQSDLEKIKATREIRRLCNQGRYKEAQKLLDAISGYKGMSKQDIQFCDMMNTMILCAEGLITKETALQNDEKTLRMTCKSYRIDNLPKIMTFNEISLLNKIACCYDDLGQSDKAITILYHIISFHKSGIVDEQESLRTLPMVLYNLSNILGMSGNYDECLSICNEGIELETKTKSYYFLPSYMYNKGWALTKRGRAEDREEAKKLLLDAYDLSRIINDRPNRTRLIAKMLSADYGLLV